MLQRLHGILFILIGLGSIGDGWRIAQQARAGANFDAIGPDRYLAALGAVMLLAGLWSLLLRPETEPAAPRAEPSEGTLPTLLLTLGLVAAFALAIPIIGFSPACFLFLALQLWVLSGWSWWVSFAAAVPIALGFHLAFVTFSDMPFPKGYFGI